METMNGDENGDVIHKTMQAIVDSGKSQNNSPKLNLKEQL